MPAPTSGLARVTIRAPRRRLDLAVPDQVPLAEILPEVLRRAGEPGDDARTTGSAGAEPGGWSLRRADGAALAGATALAHQGVRDGDVLYLVPGGVCWPEPAYDDVVEEIAASARRHGPAWDARATRLFALATAGFVLLTGLAMVVAVGPEWTIPALVAATVAGALIATGALLSRALGDGVAGAVAAGFALPYAAVGATLGLAGDTALPALRPEHLLVGASALLLASVVGAVAVGHGLPVFAGGAAAALFGSVAAILALAVSGAGAAAIVLVALVAGIGVAPIVAVRLGRLPIPVVSAAAEDLAAEQRPEPPLLHAAVARADDLLSGSLLGIAAAAIGCTGMLAATTGLAGPLLGALGSVALLLRARLFPSVAARLPLLTAGLSGLALVGWTAMAGAGPAVRLFGAALAVGTVAAVLATAATAYRRHGRSPYLTRLADVLDVLAVVALAPVALAVLDLYSRVRGLAG